MHQNIKLWDKFDGPGGKLYQLVIFREALDVAVLICDSERQPGPSEDLYVGHIICNKDFSKTE